MSPAANRPASTVQVVVAFTILYIVWGSTYFFIRMSVAHIPPMMVGVLRFLLAGALMLLWCLFTKETLFSWKVMRPAIVSGLLLLGFGNGALIWSEQYIPSSRAAYGNGCPGRAGLRVYLLGVGLSLFQIQIGEWQQ